MGVIYTIPNINPFHDPDIRTGLTASFTLPNTAKYVQRVSVNSDGITITLGAKQSAQFSNTGSIGYVVVGQGGLVQDVEPGETVRVSWDVETGVHVADIVGGGTVSEVPDLVTLSANKTLTAQDKYRQVITATTDGLVVTVPAERSHVIYNNGTRAFDLEVIGLTTQIVLPNEEITVTWNSLTSQHTVVSQINEGEKPKGTVRVAAADGTVSTFESDGTINGNGEALVAAMASLTDGSRLYADGEATYAMPAITELNNMDNVKLIGNGARIQPRDDIAYYTNIFWVENSERVTFKNWNLDGLSGNYDAWELPSNDPDFSIEAKVVSKNNNPSPQGSGKTQGGRFFVFKNCTNSGTIDCDCQGNSTSIVDGGGFVPVMWSADAVFVTGGQNNYIKRCTFYRPGYSAIRGESDNLLIDNCEVRNAIWHGIVLNATAAGHTATVSNTVLIIDTPRHLPSDCLDLNATVATPYDRFTMINVSVRTTGHLPGGKAWAAGETIGAGQYRYTNSKWYYSTSSGTTANAPSHTTGSASGADGINWHFVSAFTGVQRVKFGAVRRTTLTGVHVDIADSQYFTSAIYTQDQCDELYMNDCIWSHSFAQINQSVSTRKISIKNSTIGYRGGVTACSVKSLDTEITNSILHYRAIAVDHSGVIGPENKLVFTDNIMVPSQEQSSNAFLSADWLGSARAGNVIMVRNRLYDAVNDDYYDANTGFTNGSGFYARTSDTTEMRQLLHQAVSGELIYDGLVTTNSFKSSAQAAAPWFNDGSLLVTGRPGLVIRNHTYNPAGSGAALVPAWQWDATASAWVAQ